MEERQQVGKWILRIWSVDAVKDRRHRLASSPQLVCIVNHRVSQVMLLLSKEKVSAGYSLHLSTYWTCKEANRSKNCSKEEVLMSGPSTTEAANV